MCYILKKNYYSHLIYSPQIQCDVIYIKKSEMVIK